MEEGFLDVLFGCTPFSEVETQLSPIVGTKRHYVFGNLSACISEVTGSSLDLLSGTINSEHLSGDQYKYLRGDLSCDSDS